MRPSWCPSWPELLICCGLWAHPAHHATREEPVFGITHRNSVSEEWPFGLDEVSTKIVAEPGDPEAVADSYWVVRSQGGDRAGGGFGALRFELSVRAEFPGTAFAPEPGRDFTIVTGTDRHGTTITELDAGRFAVEVPAAPDARQAGFMLRARFPGDRDGPEPPRSLLIDLERGVDVASERELCLGEHLARWLIVDPDGGGRADRK